MLVSPFAPSLAQRFESGLIGLALGCLANQSLTTNAIDRYWEMLHRNIDQVGDLDRPLVPPAAPSTQEEAEWSVLPALPWLWVLLEDEAGQQFWLAQQPDPRRALLLQSFTNLSDGYFNHGLNGSKSPRLSPILSPFAAAQAVWDQAVQLTENAVPLAEGLKQWQTNLGHLPPDLNAIGIALWLTWRSDNVTLTLALAQQLSSDRFNLDQTIAPFYSPHLLPFAGLLGGFAWFSGLPVRELGGNFNASVLRQYSDRLFRAWAGIV